MNYQKIILAGNVTDEPRSLISQKGDVSYTTFGVGVGDGKERTTFFSILAFGKLGEAVANHVTKGRQVLVAGRVQVSDKGRFRVIADTVRFGSEPNAAKASE